MKQIGKWWVGQRVTCRKCGENLELEVGDTPYHGGQDGYFIQVDCPCCGGPVNVRKPYGAEVRD